MADEEEVVLLDLWASPFAMRTRVALAEKGIRYESKEQDLMNKSDLLLQSNPVYKKVPVLIHGSNPPICESLIQVQYIDEVWRHKGPSLLPSHPYQRAHARFWADFVDKKVFEGGRKMWQKKGEELEAGKNELIEALKVMESELGEKAYFGGEVFGFIDLALISHYTWFYAYENWADFSVEAQCPILAGWAERCMQREIISKTLPTKEKVNDFFVEVRKLIGLE